MVQINVYNVSDVLNFLKDNYSLKDIDLWPTDKGLDNTVFFVGNFIEKKPLYVLKIVETKHKSDIENSIRIFQDIPKEFTNLNYIKSNNLNFVEDFDNNKKCAVLMTYIKGKEPNLFTFPEVIKYANFIKGFHNLQTDLQPDKINKFIDNEFKLINQYWCNEVKEGVLSHFPSRSKFYHKMVNCVLEGKSKFTNYMSNIPCLVGITHNDFTTANVIEDQNLNYNIIDFDSIELKGFQLIDLLQAVSKSPISTDSKKVEYFLKSYFNTLEEGLLPQKNIEKICESFKNWQIVFSLRAMLSTDYYTFKIPKLTPEWSKLNVDKLLSHLEKGITENITNEKKVLCHHL
ncbi:hypothetical protein [Wolbachia endosymbiont (group A) of Agelastica alni]|uniref:hypothetical protein n=1 Tax=Wolbachia endosymbiont (group A) of Agelastica alni TaxID=3066130 RepID=UPI003132BE2E